MSIEVLLIPLGIAAFGAATSMVKEAMSTDLCEKCRATRIMDPALLVAALAAMGATTTSNSESRVLAKGPWGDLTFQKVGDVFLGRVDGNEGATPTMLAELDVQVGRVVQGRTAALVVERAKELGFRLIEQQEDDGALNYVFEEIR